MWKFSQRSTCILFVAMTSSSLYADDSWRHYENGGSFATSSPTVSRDGGVLVYATPCSGHGDIYSIKHGADTPVRLTNNIAFEASPIITRDAKRIVYCREDKEYSHIWIMNADGSSQTRLTSGEFHDAPRAVSSNGRYLIFHRGVDSPDTPRLSTAYVMRIDKLPALPIRVGIGAIFTPDSRRVVYAKNMISAGPGKNPYHPLMQLDLESDDQSRRSHGGRGYPLTFSPDGKYLLTTRYKANVPWTIDQGLWIRDVINGREKHVANGHSAVLFGANKCRMLYFVGFNRSPQICDMNGENRSSVACGEWAHDWPQVCMQGKTVVLGAFKRSGSPDFNIYYILSNDLTSRLVALIDCNRANFFWGHSKK